MNRLIGVLVFAFVVVAAVAVLAPHVQNVSASDSDDNRYAANHTPEIHALKMIAHGRETFRFDTFGDQKFWGGSLQLHKAIEGQKLGGVGPGVDPATALAVGLKVDVDALPDTVRQALKAGKVDLKDPATTLALLKFNSVVGVTGFFNNSGTLRSVGIQCAFCHSTVDNSFAPGIGHRLDGMGEPRFECRRDCESLSRP